MRCWTTGREQFQHTECIPSDAFHMLLLVFFTFFPFSTLFQFILGRGNIIAVRVKDDVQQQTELRNSRLLVLLSCCSTQSPDALVIWSLNILKYSSSFNGPLEHVYSYLLSNRQSAAWRRLNILTLVHRSKGPTCFRTVIFLYIFVKSQYIFPDSPTKELFCLCCWFFMYFMFDITRR